MSLARSLRSPSDGSPRRLIPATLIVDRDHYDELLLKRVRKARVSVWIGTANLKDVRIEASVGSRDRARGKFTSLLDTLMALAKHGVDVRLLHGGKPSRAFEAAWARQTPSPHFQRRVCPRVHLKLVAIDGTYLYLGSANLTGAGLGAKGEGRRNFEMGILTSDDLFLDAAQARFEAIWSGKECGPCRLRSLCPKPLDTVQPEAPAISRKTRRGHS